jgi:hypothetical protein
VIQPVHDMDVIISTDDLGGRCFRFQTQSTPEELEAEGVQVIPHRTAGWQEEYDDIMSVLEQMPSLQELCAAEEYDPLLQSPQGYGLPQQRDFL